MLKLQCSVDAARVAFIWVSWEFHVDTSPDLALAQGHCLAVLLAREIHYYYTKMRFLTWSCDSASHAAEPPHSEHADRALMGFLEPFVVPGQPFTPQPSGAA